MKLVFRPEAQLELLEARDWYETRAVGLGFEFARSIDAAAGRILRAPTAFAHFEGDYRRCVLRRFPYSLIYRLHDDTVVIVSVFHHRREPDSWQASR